MVEDEDDKGRKTGKFSLIFPRYHQLDCVRRLLADAKRRGAGQHYLIQHSAGSGKSNSIAWLAHQLSILHDDNDEPVFQSIIVITDRRVLDRQLQRTVRQFELTDGIVENIDTTSKKLKQALADGKKIIVTTLQKFPFVAKDMSELKGKRFAVIIDEAHSSQSGSSTDGLKKVRAVKNLEEAEREENKVLAVKNLEEAERAENEEEQLTEDGEDLIVKEVRSRGRLPDVSYFAFTATPKDKTLQLFGVQKANGSYEPFSLYSMKQAIEEGFILDVLQNYVTYKAYWNLLKKIEQDPRYEKGKASALLRAFVDINEHVIDKKVAVIVEHFAQNTAQRIGGKAKAMIVTRSRLHAVRYKHAMDRYLKAHGYLYKALVAFSGTVQDFTGSYTESEMNDRIPESQTAEAFKRDEYRFLIVANKFQTGFDQPLLHTMYVDKKLGGVNAVQTLSRLNRVYPGKQETMVLDFANDSEKIQTSFAPYFVKTFLAEGVDPNLLYDTETRLNDFGFYTEDEVDRVGTLWYDPQETQASIHNILDAVVARYQEAHADQRRDFRKELTDYIRLYSFLVQINTFVDVGLEKLYVFSRFLVRKLPTPDGQFPTEILQYIDIDSYRLQQTNNGKIALEQQTEGLKPMRTKRTRIVLPDEKEPLSQIILRLNEIAGGVFTEEDKVCIEELETRLANSQALKASVHVNPPDGVRLVFEEVLNDLLQSMMEGNLKFYKHVNDDENFSKRFIDILFERYMKEAKNMKKLL